MLSTLHCICACGFSAFLLRLYRLSDFCLCRILFLVWLRVGYFNMVVLGVYRLLGCSIFASKRTARVSMAQKKKRPPDFFRRPPTLVLCPR